MTILRVYTIQFQKKGEFSKLNNQKYYEFGELINLIF